MPAKSKKQYQFMKAVAENKKFADKVGVPQSVGKEFTKVKKYEKGGKTMSVAEKKKLRKEMTPYQQGYDEALSTSLGRNKVLREIGYKVSPAIMMTASEKKGFKKGAEDTEKALKYKKQATKKKSGGKIGMGMTKNNYKKGGKVSSCSKRADGCAVKGKTKGRMV